MKTCAKNRGRIKVVCTMMNLGFDQGCVIAIAILPLYKLFVKVFFKTLRELLQLQGVKGESGKSLSSKFGQNQCLYYNKQYISRKPLISAFIWHPESGRGNIRRAWPCHRRQRVKNPSRAPMLFAARERGGLLVMPRPLSGCQMKAEIQGFLLIYCLFL